MTTTRRDNIVPLHRPHQRHVVISPAAFWAGLALGALLTWRWRR